MEMVYYIITPLMIVSGIIAIGEIILFIMNR